MYAYYNSNVLLGIIRSKHYIISIFYYSLKSTESSFFNLYGNIETLFLMFDLKP